LELLITEHRRKELISLIVENELAINTQEFLAYATVKPRCFSNSRQKNIPYYKLHNSGNKIEFEADYYIGIDWIIPNKKYVYVAPKINTLLIEKFKRQTESEYHFDIDEENKHELDERIEFAELNYLKMYLDAASHPEIFQHTEKLLFIDWESQPIPITQQQDILTPFLVVQFLNLLKQIVRKGLKKSYYKVEQNLQGRIKGKILVAGQIKINVMKNRITTTLCSYEQFGIDNIENRLLKKVLDFVSNYINNNSIIFKGSDKNVQQLVSYCKPAFQQVSDEIDDYSLKHFKNNAFFKEYKEALKIGDFILKRFAYSISTTTEQKVLTPPFWIDMPRLFELYVYRQLLQIFSPNEINYHVSTYGNELDFLITKEGYKMVIDAKYKMHYKSSHIHNDIRQVSGYARLKKVYDMLYLTEEENKKIIDCLIIYPDIECKNEFITNEELKNKKQIMAYRNVYKIGINLPIKD